MNGLRCKPGDLAIVVAGANLEPPNMGAIVRVARLSSGWVDAWELDPPCIDPVDGFEVHAPDHHLKPIRDPGDDAVDEMTLIAGKPTEVTAWI